MLPLVPLVPLAPLVWGTAMFVTMYGAVVLVMVWRGSCDQVRKKFCSCIIITVPGSADKPHQSGFTLPLCHSPLRDFHLLSNADGRRQCIHTAL